MERIILTLEFGETMGNQTFCYVAANGNGKTVDGLALTTAVVGTSATWKYYSALDKWLRVK